MKKIKTLLFIFVLIIQSVAIAKDYIVEAENENISCKLSTILPKDFLRIIDKKKISD